MAEGKRTHQNGHDSGTESPEMAVRSSQSNGFTRTSNSNSKMNNFKKDTKTKSNTRGVISGLTGSAAKSSGRLKCKVILLDGEEFETEIDVSNLLNKSTFSGQKTSKLTKTLPFYFK